MKKITGNVTITGDATGAINLQNLNITGSLTINTPDAHVNVKASSTVGGATNIQDVSNTSFVSDGSHTGGILVTDANNSRISLSGNASKAAVTIDTTGNVSLAGTFENNINIVKAAKINVEQAATVALLTVVPSASGTTIANAGIITEVVAPADVQLTGTQPVKFTPVGGSGNEIINLNLAGVPLMELAGVTVESDYLINHIGYSVNIQSNTDNKVKYVYFGDFENSQENKVIRTHVNGLINRNNNSGGFSRGVQSEENVLSVDRFIMIVYLDENMNPIGYKEERKTLNKTKVKISDDLSELSKDEVNQYIYFDNGDNLKFDATDYFAKNNSAKFISVHYSTKVLSIEDLLERKNNAHEAIRLDKTTIRTISKSNILSLPTSPFNTMIVIYDKDFNVLDYGIREISM